MLKSFTYFPEANCVEDSLESAPFTSVAALQEWNWRRTSTRFCLQLEKQGSRSTGALEERTPGIRLTKKWRSSRQCRATSPRQAGLSLTAGAE